MNEEMHVGHVPDGTRPPQPPPPAAQRVADELLMRHGLGHALQLEVAPGGLLNQNLFATTAKGSFFLKGYRYPDPAPIAREHKLIAFLRSYGVFALAPLPSPSGDTFVRVGGRHWAVFSRLDAAHPSRDAVTPQVAAEIGRTLGQIHVALASLPPLDAAQFPAKHTWSTERVIDDMIEYEMEIGRRLAPDPFDQHALRSFAYRRTLLAAGIPAPEEFAHLPSQVLHGDYHAGNLFVGEDGLVCAVIDWELACTGARAWEIVRALNLALPLRDDLTEGGSCLRAFIHGYAAVAMLTHQECDAMPELYWAARVHSLWVYEEHYRKGAARTDRLAMEDLETLHWLASHRQELRLALTDALATAPGRQLSRSS